MSHYVKIIGCKTFALINEIGNNGKLLIYALLGVTVFVLISRAVRKNSVQYRNNYTEKTVGKNADPAQCRGMSGEIEVRKILGKLGKEYCVINDVMVDSSYRTAQIDHIIVSRYGIFVIETKNYRGLLHGDERDNYISHEINGKKYMIYNPLKQNSSHVRALANKLDYADRSVFVPILALSDGCSFEITAKSDVVPFSTLCGAIKKYNEICFSDDEVKKIINRIHEINVLDEEERNKHIERAKLLQECIF